MRTILLVILLVVTINSTTTAQTRQQKNDSVFALVQKFINQQNADAMYAMAGDEFKTHVSRDDFAKVTKDHLFPLGSIKDAALLSYKDSVSTYKVTFASAALEMFIGLNEKNMLQIYAFRLYKEPIANKILRVPSSNPMKTPLDKKLDSIARRYIQKVNTAGLSIGILKDGRMSTYGYGETTKGTRKLPDENTIFEIGSITKTFTATLLAYYVNENKVHLNDAITQYLPDSVAANKQLQGITLLMLSNHTSGLPSLPDNFEEGMQDSLNPYKDYNRTLLFSYLKHCTPDTLPGSNYNYSNMAAGLLGIILEHVSGMSYEQMVEGIICKPLQMNSTAQHLNAALREHFVTVYNDKGNVTPAWDFDALASAGSLHSTVHDMLLYAKANLKTGNDPLAKAIALTHKTTITVPVPVGLGWHGGTSKGNAFLWHNGGTYGSSSYLAFIPGKDVAVVVLSNAAEQADAVGNGLLAILQ